MSRERLLEAAIHHAEKGFPATGNQSRTTTAKLAELKGLPGYDEAFLLNGIVPAEGDMFPPGTAWRDAAPAGRGRVRVVL
jgi:gamma-glutamyltranspeptidase/glutathione hydrolase